MHQTKLVEITNKTNDLLRGILLSGEKNNKVVLMCGGFERSATTEKKFKILADKLIDCNIASLRFDCTGCGLSDGDFSRTTVSSIGSDIQTAVDFLKKEAGVKNISLVCHSLSSCAAGSALNKENFENIILLAPALNQKDLLRYWFVISDMKNNNPDIEINWNNFKEYLDESKFQKECLRTNKMSKVNYISSDYFLENKDKDYSNYFTNNQNVLYVHGDKDDKVPQKSLNLKFNNEIIVKDGDHDLERPDMFDQWIEGAVNFIK